MLSQTRLHELFDYADGSLYWKAGRQRTKAGSRAGSLHKSGYVSIVVNGKFNLAHRLIWQYFHGDVPPMLDHLNRVKHDNRIENLRPASKEQNMWNTPLLRKSNTSGYRGVSWDRNMKGWRVSFEFKNEARYLGVFNCPEEAAMEYDKAVKELHGEFAVLNFPGEAGSTT